MDHLPTPSVDRPPVLVRAAIYLLAPVLLLVTLPIILLLVLALYLLALFQGGRVFMTVIVGKPDEPEHDLQPPHFLELPAAAKALPGESTPSTKN
jgi:hypothetical protein